HLRLRSVPRADLTLVRSGNRDQLLKQAMAIRSAGDAPAALGLGSPGATGKPEWTLAVRLLRSEAAVDEARRAVNGALNTMEEMAPAAGAAFWASLGAAPARRAVTLRLGALPSALAQAMDLVAHHL